MAFVLGTVAVVFLMRLRESVAPPTDPAPSSAFALPAKTAVDPQDAAVDAAFRNFAKTMKAINKDTDDEAIMKQVDSAIDGVFGPLLKEDDGSSLDLSPSTTEDDQLKKSKRDPAQRQELLDFWGGADGFITSWKEAVTEGPEDNPTKKKLLGTILGNYKNTDAKCYGEFSALVEIELMLDNTATPASAENEQKQPIPQAEIDKMHRDLGLGKQAPSKAEMDAVVTPFLGKFDWEKSENDAAEEEIKKMGKWVFVDPSYGFTFTSLRYKTPKMTEMKDGTSGCRSMQADMQEILFEDAGDKGFKFDPKRERNGYLMSEVIGFVKVSIQYCKTKLSLGDDVKNQPPQDKLYKMLQNYICKTGFTKPRWMLSKKAKYERVQEYEDGSKLLESFVNCVNFKMVSKVGNHCANVFRKYNIGRKVEMEVCNRKGLEMAVRSVAKGIKELIYFVPTFTFKYWQFRGVAHLTVSERIWLAFGSLVTSLAGYVSLAFQWSQFAHDYHILKFFVKEFAIHAVAHFQIHAIKEAVERYNVQKCSHFDASKEVSFLAEELDSFKDFPDKATYLADINNNWLRLGGDDSWKYYFFIVRDESKQRAAEQMNGFRRLLAKTLSSDKNYDLYTKYTSDLMGLIPLTPEQEDDTKNLQSARMFGYFTGWYQPQKDGPSEKEDCTGYFSGAFDVALVRPAPEAMKKLSSDEKAAEEAEAKAEAEAEKSATGDDLAALKEAKLADNDEFTPEDLVMNPGAVEEYKAKQPKSVWEYKYTDQGFDQQLVFDKTGGSIYDVMKETDSLSANENGDENKKAHMKALNILINGKNEVSYALGAKDDTSKHKLVKAKKTTKQKAAQGACRNLAADVMLQLMQSQPKRVSMKMTGFTPRQVRAIVRASVASCLAKPDFKGLKEGPRRLICAKKPDNMERFMKAGGALQVEEWSKTSVKIIGCVAKEAMLRLGDDKCKHLLEGDQVVVALEKQLCGKKGWNIFRLTWHKKSFRKIKNVVLKGGHTLAEEWGFMSNTRISEWTKIGLGLFALEATLVEIAVPVLAVAFFVAEFTHLWPAVLANLGFKMMDKLWMKKIKSVSVMKCSVEQRAHKFSQSSVNDMTEKFLKGLEANTFMA